MISLQFQDSSANTPYDGVSIRAPAGALPFTVDGCEGGGAAPGGYAFWDEPGRERGCWDGACGRGCELCGGGMGWPADGGPGGPEGPTV